ncbi:MAG: hypothetical protein J5I90_04630 [Caldilineales bacterium]|nr:hypothetical protein [Caldilineales bacterium]
MTVLIEPNKPTIVRASQVLFYANAVVWLALGAISLWRLSASPAQSLTFLIVALLMFGNVAAMLLAGWGLGKLRRRYFYLAIFVLVINIILTFTDEFGLLDFLTLMLDLTLLGMLIYSRRLYFGR